MVKHSNLLIIFLKNPVRGMVKTRLAKTIGEEQALNVYYKLVNLTLAEADKIQSDLYLLYSSDVPKEWPWGITLQSHYKSEVQEDSPDLGKRMQKAFTSHATYKKIVLIGSDCPDISAEILQTAFDQLEGNDMVVGPANDGGFYLLGLKKWQPGLFENITWSTGSVLEKLIRNFKRIKSVKYHELPLLTDIDTSEDLVNYSNLVA